MSAPRLRRDIARYCRQYLVYFLPIGFLAYLMLESYQIDFRAFYLAGKAVVYGLDPYLNHVGQFPEFYGPVNAETSAASGFRYPPLAALVFAPLGWLTYDVAKALFTLVMLIMLMLLGFHMVRRSRFQLPGEALLFMFVSFPVLALVERGQVDSLVVYLTVLSYWLMSDRYGRPIGSLVLAFVGLLKLFPLVLLIYYGLQRQWRFILWTLGWLAVLLFLPWLVLGSTVYEHFWMRTLPTVFGEITASQPIDLHGQGVVLNRIVQSVDSIDLLVTHDFVNGYMNPLLQNSTAGSVLSGLILSGLMLLAVNRCPSDLRFYSFLNVINLFNPVAWIMGLIWYVPLFLHLFPRVTNLGKWLILLPLFMPPFLNINAILAYVLSIVFALATQIPALQRYLLREVEGIT